MKPFSFVFWGLFCSVVSAAQSSLPFDQAESQLEAILRPHVAPIDRNMVVFRYEAQDPKNFHPSTEQDLVNREYSWAKRFFNPDIVNNPDGGGPGLYTSTDPTATATWGLTTPGLFVLTLKKNSNVLIGDEPEVTDQDRSRINQLYASMNCGQNPYVQQMDDFSDVVTKFRNAGNPDCRRLIIQTMTQMQVRAITYSFYSSPLENCRATGTAINIIGPDALNLSSINYYTGDVTVTGDKNLTPFVKMLFDEGKSYFYTQISMANAQIRAKLENDYGFFSSATAVDQATYERWKADHILRCGAVWPIERPDYRSVTNLNGRHNADQQVQDLFAKTTLAYNGRNFQWDDKTTQGAEAEFQINEMRQIEDLQYRQMQVTDQQLPELEWRQLKDVGDFQSLDKIANSLGENFPANAAEFNQALVKSLGQIDPSHDNDPFLVAVMLRLAGVGSRMTAFVFNSNQFSQGTIPVLDGAVPTDFNAANASLLTQNRTLYLNILQQCLAIYSNPNISNQAVFAGPCGIANASVHP